MKASVASGDHTAQANCLPIFYTLYSIPDILHPIFYTLYSIPYILYPTFYYPIFYTLYSILDIIYPISWTPDFSLSSTLRCTYPTAGSAPAALPTPAVPTVPHHRVKSAHTEGASRR